MEQKVAGLTVYEQALAWFEANKKQVAWGAGIITVVGLIVAYYVWSQREKQISAGQALTNVMAAPLSSGGQPESAEAYLKVAADRSGTGAGARALLAAGGVLFDQGKYAEAQTQFQKFSREYPDNPFRSQALLGVAAALDAQAKLDEAARAYKDLIDRHPGDVVVPQAKFALARIYESQNRFKEARDLYEDVGRTQGYSSLGNEAGMKAEELRSKLPQPTAATSTNSSFPILSTQPTTKTNQP